MNVGLKTQILPVDEAALAVAARVLAQGGLVAFPTETVYGLGADATNPAAIARLYQAKGRPSFNPLIAHVFDLKTSNCAVADLATAGLDTVAIRIPAHKVARQILRAFGGAVVAPSANLSGHVSPTTALHVQSDLEGRIDLIIDGGPVEVGVESTIIGCFEAPQLLRPGGVPRDLVERVLGHALEQPSPDAESDTVKPPAPGMLGSHYAPRSRLRLNAAKVEAGEALLAFGPAMPEGADGAKAVMNLSTRGDLVEAAANLFGYLRALDARAARAIAVMPIPQDGLGEAINDRLRRAAMGRE